jgi:uncharacterized protein YjbK
LQKNDKLPNGKAVEMLQDKNIKQTKEHVLGGIITRITEEDLTWETIEDEDH